MTLSTNTGYHGTIKLRCNFDGQFILLKQLSDLDRISNVFNFSEKFLEEFKSNLEKFDLKNKNIIFLYISTGNSSTGLGVESVKLVENMLKIHILYISTLGISGTCDIHRCLKVFSAPKNINAEHIEISYGESTVDFFNKKNTSIPQMLTADSLLFTNN